jgi:hypothetical protein
MDLIERVEQACQYSKEKSDKFGEVFTPKELIIEMLKSLPKEVWSDEKKRWWDPCAGKGNFPAVIVTILMKGLREKFPNADERYRHIIENQIFMSEYQRESAQVIQEIFSDGGRYRLNLFVGDALTMPEDFFDLTPEERRQKYPDNTI